MHRVWGHAHLLGKHVAPQEDRSSPPYDTLAPATLEVHVPASWMTWPRCRQRGMMGHTGRAAAEDAQGPAGARARGRAGRGRGQDLREHEAAGNRQRVCVRGQALPRVGALLGQCQGGLGG